MKRFLKIILFATLAISSLMMIQVFANQVKTSSKYINTTEFLDRNAVHVPFNLPYFSGIDANGDFQIIVTSGKQQSVVLNGHPMAVSRVNASVQNGTLVLRTVVARSESKSYNPRVLVRIILNHPISAIILAGKSSLHASGIRTSSLVIYTRGNSGVYLRGSGNVQRVQNDSSRDIDLGWVTSRSIVIAGSGTGWVRLSGGYADILTARLRNGACLQAENLKANKVYVETEGYSIARIQPVNSLYAFATDDSNIYYFRVPREIAGYTKESGNVLKVASW